MRAGLPDVAATLSGWPASFAGPALMPVSATVWVGASSLSVTGLGGSSVGASLIGLRVTGKVRVTVLVVPWPSFTVTLRVTGPPAAVLASAAGVKVSVAVLLGKALVTAGLGIRPGWLDRATRLRSCP